jgi:hypothetical protein
MAPARRPHTPALNWCAHCWSDVCVIDRCANWNGRFAFAFGVIVKWFVGYPIYADGPDHCTLERFEVWVAEHQHRAVFDEILRQIDQAMPEERQAAQHWQVGDTYAQRANAAKEQLVRLIRHACERLLRTWRAKRWCARRWMSPHCLAHPRKSVSTT